MGSRKKEKRSNNTSSFIERSDYSKFRKITDKVMKKCYGTEEHKYFKHQTDFMRKILKKGHKIENNSNRNIVNGMIKDWLKTNVKVSFSLIYKCHLVNFFTINIINDPLFQVDGPQGDSKKEILSKL